MDETDHGLTPRIANLKVNRKVNEINDLPIPPPRQCWVCVPPVIALKTSGPLDILLSGYIPRSIHSLIFDVDIRRSRECYCLMRPTLQEAESDGPWI